MGFHCGKALHLRIIEASLFIGGGVGEEVYPLLVGHVKSRRSLEGGGCSISCMAVVVGEGEGEGVGYSFVACLSHLTSDHASLSRRSGRGWDVSGTHGEVRP